jgi:DNA-binding CsgD family transcriptional regulator
MAALDPTRFKLYQPEQITNLMKSIYPTLTPREGICLFWTCVGLTKKEIADPLGISENTVKFHINSAINKQETSSIRDIKISFLTNIILFYSFN